MTYRNVIRFHLKSATSIRSETREGPDCEVVQYTFQYGIRFYKN